MKIKNLYIIIGVLFIISLMNILLGNILFKNININLYDPNPDIQKDGKVLMETLEKHAVHNSQIEIKNNGNSKGDYYLQKHRKEIYSKKMADIVDNGDPITKCYTFEKDIDKDNCIKDYATMFLSGISGISNTNYYNIDTIRNYCSYGQRGKKEIKQCIDRLFLQKHLNLFLCSDIFSKEPDLEEKCFDIEFEDYINKTTSKYYSKMLMVLNKGLVKIDKQGRVITKQVNSKILQKHPEYATMFTTIQPYFIDTEILETPQIKNNKHLYNYLSKKIKYYNNVNQFNVFPNSIFKKNNPNLFK